VTPEGAKLGITNEMANCCETHNSFEFPPPAPLVTLEKDTAGKAETIALFEGEIGMKGFVKLATKLEGGGQSGTEISVPENTAVTDTATLEGEEVSTATGTVEYKVYSDPECTKLVTSAGSASVSGGVAGSSEAESFATAGTYYWQASYSGDAAHEPAKSGCRGEIEKVGPVAEECKEVAGVGHFGAHSPEGTNLDNVLNTSGTPHGFELTAHEIGLHMHLISLNAGAKCTIAGGTAEFSGSGPARVNHETGYTATFTFTQTGGNTFLTLKIEKEGVVVYEVTNQQLNKASKEHFR
jgi:hypothetical protein